MVVQPAEYLVLGKRRLALRVLALGIDALARFVRCEPLRWLHECVLAVLALESEPVDQRLRVAACFLPCSASALRKFVVDPAYHGCTARCGELR